MSVRTALSASSRVGRTGAEELARVRFEFTTLSIRFLRPRHRTSMNFSIEQEGNRFRLNRLAL